MTSYTHENIHYDSDIDIKFRVQDFYRCYTALHWHNSMEILYILDGKEECFLDENRHYILQQGDFILINPREIHSTQMHEHSRELLLQFPYPFLKRYIPDIDNIRFNCTAFPGDTRRIQARQKIQECLHSISLLYPLDSSPYVLQFHSLIFELLFHFMQSFREDMTPLEKETSAKYMERLGRITSFVKEHYAEDISLNQIAGLVSLNPDYFTRFFKKYMGITFLDYVNSIRLEHVARDLLKTDLSVQDLLERHGFTNYKLFMKMYKSRFNCTPGEMRRHASQIREE